MKNLFKYIIVIFLLTITLYSRFFNLNWDDGWGFHPDENNLWGASRSIKWFSNLDPKFYAYGGFPVYLYSFFDSKVQARAVSALLQTGIIGLLFLTGRKLKGERAGFLAALIGILSAGLVQAAHFLTVESLIGFFGLMILFSLLNYEDKDSKKNIWLILAAVTFGLGISTKVSFVVFVLPISAIILRPGLVGKSKARPLLALLSILGVSTLIFFLTNPFILSKFQDVRSTLLYEANVAMGKMAVFYTRQFTETVSGLFQIVRVFPFITGWLFFPILLTGVFIICFKESPCRTARRLLMGSMIATLFSFLPMWAKWTRYVVQVLPILILIAAIGVDWLWEKGKIGKAIAVLAVISFLPQLFSIMKVYGSPDNRLAAADWAAVNIPENAKIFTESMDLGIIPFNPVHGENITLFNFYELDEDKTGQRQKALDSLINESDYFISVSNRVYGNSLKLPDKFPFSAEFYSRLFDGFLGFEKIYESPSIVIPAKARFDSARRAGIYLNRFRARFAGATARRVQPGMTVGFSPEETFQVFDHPKVMIFEKK